MREKWETKSDVGSLMRPSFLDLTRTGCNAFLFEMISQTSSPCLQPYIIALIENAPYLQLSDFQIDSNTKARQREVANDQHCHGHISTNNGKQIYFLNIARRIPFHLCLKLNKKYWIVLLFCPLT